MTTYEEWFDVGEVWTNLGSGRTFPPALGLTWRKPDTASVP